MKEYVRAITIPVISIFLLCAIVLLLVHRYTADKISENARDHELKIVTSLMTLPHDNNLLDDYLVLKDADAISGQHPLTAFRAKQGGKTVGIVFKPVTAVGYMGPIELAIAVSADNSVLGIKTIRHRETEGLGAQIDGQSSNWPTIFAGVHFNNMQPQDWTVRSRGGRFDQISGATITSRGVINAVRKTLEFHYENHDRLYNQ